jgi:DNA repair protein RadC
MRSRERYATDGGAEFGVHELVALVLGTGTASRSVLEVAGALIDQFGGYRALSRAQVQELAAVHGVGLARAVRLHAAFELGRRALAVPEEHDRPVTGPADACAWLGPGLRGLVVEELHALYLDRRGRPLGRRMLTRGSDAFTVVDPRQVFRPAVALGAAGVVIAHNHPSGDPTPSPQDRDVTRRVAAAGRVLGVPLVDHLVIADDGVVSLAELGLLERWPAPQIACTQDVLGVRGSPRRVDRIGLKSPPPVP